MRLTSSVITLIGVAIHLVVEAAPSSKTHQIAGSDSASNFNHLNPSKATMQIQRGDILPVSYIQRPHGFRQPRLHYRQKFGKKKKMAGIKRDFETTLQHLRAAMNNYKKDLAAPPPVGFVQLEQQLPPPPAAEIAPAVVAPPPPPPAVDPVPNLWAVPVPPAPEVVPPPDLQAANPPLPDLSQEAAPEIDPTAATAFAPEVELGNETTEATTVSTDIEEDDIYDPEEDPDDAGDPPSQGREE